MKRTRILPDTPRGLRSRAQWLASPRWPYWIRRSASYDGPRVRGRLRLFVPRSSGHMRHSLFSDFHGNCWRADGRPPRTNRGGLIR